MRAVLMTAAGGPDVLKVVKLPEPEITSEHDVVVRLRAAGINPVDYKLRANGTIGGTLPAILGWDGAGIVESIGPLVNRVKPGDEVYFCDGGFGPTPGTYQQAKIVDERYLAHKPTHLSFAEAAAAPLVTITTWEAQRERARVTEDQFVLVQAGAGGVGHMSVQIARLAGARVATTVTAGQKSDLASSLGAELCIDYRNEDVGERLRSWTGVDGADVVHDTVGGKTFTACFSLVRPYGDLVSNVESHWEEEAIKEMHDRNLPRLVYVDAGTVSVRLVEAARAAKSHPRAGGTVLRHFRPARRGWRDLSARTGGRRASSTGGRGGRRQGRPHHGLAPTGRLVDRNQHV